MIEPTYRRDQLWKPRRSYVPGAVVAGGILYLLLTISLGDAEVTGPSCVGNSPRCEARALLVTIIERWSAWRLHHAECPARLSELARETSLDPWGHALHYTCDPRLVPGHRFAVVSAGEDGVFGTADDIAAHD